MSRAIARLEASQFPARLDGATLEMLRAIAPVQSFGRRIALANPWLFRPLLIHRFLADPKMATLLPFLTGPTDSRHWSTGIPANVFRFTPFPYEKDWMARAHGTDERISQGLADGVSFYVQLIRNCERI